LARATAIDSRRALRIISLNAASSRTGPIGHPVTAVSPLKTVRRTNFDQMSTMTWSLKVASKPAVRHASSSCSSSGDVAPSSGPKIRRPMAV
jgi:hypothetical protein